jgi:very-short-patch-repair endonuclease
MSGSVSGQFGASQDDLVLVAVLPRKRDVQLLEQEGWYRVPVDKTPRRWPPKWVAFYEGVRVGEPGHIVRYGAVAAQSVRTREELFPSEHPGRRAGRRYHRLELRKLERLPAPIVLGKPRAVVFISTNLGKLFGAHRISDLFDDSPLEDSLWEALKRAALPAERQWPETVDGRNYFIDVAVFCQSGNVALEADGTTWHTGPEQVHQDALRQNDLVSKGWRPLRFNTQDIRDRLDSCIDKVLTTVTALGGPADDGLVGRRYVRDGGLRAIQLTLQEERTPYDDDSPID